MLVVGRAVMAGDGRLEMSCHWLRFARRVRIEEKFGDPTCAGIPGLADVATAVHQPARDSIENPNIVGARVCYT